MSPRPLQRWIRRLTLRVAAPDMRMWALAMVREGDEIEDPHAALRWAAACLMACAADRLRPLMIAARLLLAACCLLLAARMSLQVAPQLVRGVPLDWVKGLWLGAAALFAATSALVALRRAAASWMAVAATALSAAAVAMAMSAIPFELLSPEQLALVAQERATAYGQVAAMGAAALAAFWLTRRPANPFLA